MKTTTTAAAIAIILAAPLCAATKSITWGNSIIGATATGTMTHYVPPQGSSCSFYNTGKVDGNILWMTKNLASGAANFNFAPGSQASSASGYLKVGKNTLASWNRTFTGSDGFSTDPLLGIEKGGTYTIIPKVLSVGATASVNVRAESAVINSSSMIYAKAGVYADAAVTGNGTVNLYLLSGGLAGKMTLCQANLLCSANLKPSTDPLKFNTNVVTYRADLNTRSPHGSIEAWWKRYKGTKHSWKIVNYLGTTKSYPITSGSFELRNSTILK